uniref:hypothetical protein n=1 Tax=Parerythrobacter lutipelagi TaxID=1964208 RepID=UPI0010F48E87|nr:hypothetical protein [Parerythrobacter lutipelagi]
MLVREQISFLRGNPAPQHRAQQALERARDGWLSGPGSAIASNLADYDQGVPVEDCAALSGVLAGCDRRALEGLVSEYIDILRMYPLGHIPMRHHLSHGVGLLQLVERGRASLAIVMDEPHEERPAPQSVSFSDAERHEVVLAGRGTARVLSWSGVDGEIPASRNSVLEPGSRTSLFGMAQAKVTETVGQTLVTLRISRTAAKPRPGAEVSLADGQVIHRSVGDRDESRREIAMALLCAMGRMDAVPHCTVLASQGTAEERWQAVRHCLALDTGQGLAVLDVIAQDHDDLLCAPANALREQLFAAHPELADQEGELCLG